MLTDLRLLLWLHWRQVQRTTTYWLRVVGFDPLEETTSNRLYGLYLIIIFGGWLVLMWSLAVHEALAVGKLISVSDRARVRADFVHYFPWLFIAVGVLLVFLALRKTPLKLSVEDLTYIAASPMRRDVIGMVGFAGYVLIGWAASVPVMTLASMMLAHADSRDELGFSAYPAVLSSIPLVLLLAGIAWCFGFWRLRRPKPARFLLIWPLLIAALGAALPGVVGWPGHLMAKAVVASPLALQTLGMLVLSLIAATGVAWTGRRINLITVASELGTISQLKSLGVLGRFTWRDLSRQMRDRESLARGIPRFALPDMKGARMLTARAWLIFMRQPFRFGWAVLRATGIIAVGVILASTSASALAWLFWLSFVMALPPRDVLGVYSADQSNAFLRQFLAFDNLKLLAIDASLPFISICTIGLIGWGLVVKFGGVSPFTLPLMVTFSLMMLLSQGAALVRAPGGDPTVASLLFTGSSFGITLLFAEFTGPLVALIVSIAAIWLLGLAISSSARFSAAAFGND
ncbi:MAG: hypothetical protein WBW04_19430 [Nitrolancea sp.]